jgi:hypothetical protein
VIVFTFTLPKPTDDPKPSRNPMRAAAVRLFTHGCGRMWVWTGAADVAMGYQTRPVAILAVPFVLTFLLVASSGAIIMVCKQLEGCYRAKNKRCNLQVHNHIGHLHCSPLFSVALCSCRLGLTRLFPFLQQTRAVCNHQKNVHKNGLHKLVTFPSTGFCPDPTLRWLYVLTRWTQAGFSDSKFNVLDDEPL